MKLLFFIVNEKAANGRAQKVWKQVKKANSHCYCSLIVKFHLSLENFESDLPLKLCLYINRNTLAFCTTLSILLLPGSSGLSR